MTITVVIDNCKECRHSAHTGAFTKGGAKPCCNHDDYCHSEPSDGKDMFNCFNRVLENYPKIPSYCVLKSGSFY